MPQARISWLDLEVPAPLSGAQSIVAAESINVSESASASPSTLPVSTSHLSTLTEFAVVNRGVVTPPVIPPAGALAPLAFVEISFTTDPNDVPVWVSVTADVERFSINRGGQRFLDRINAGTMHARFRNHNRQYDSNNTAGPYYPYVLPMRRIRAYAAFDGTLYMLYSGYIDSWRQSWQSWSDAVIDVEAFDALESVSLAKLNTSFPVQTSDQRVNAVLDAISWTLGGPAWTLGVSALGINTVVGPTGDRVTTSGSAVIQAADLEDVNALQHLQDVADTEQGLLFANTSGQIEFRGRVQAYGLNQINSLATFGELELPYTNIELFYGASEIWNDVRFTRQGGIEQVAMDPTSRDQYRLRTLPRTTLDSDDVPVLSAANFKLAKSKQPKQEIIAMTLDGEINPALLYPQMLGREIGDRVTAIRRPPAGGAAISQESLIQGISTEFDAEAQTAGGLWSVEWRLSAADSQSYWVLGDSVTGRLGQTTRLFF